MVEYYWIYPKSNTHEHKKILLKKKWQRRIEKKFLKEEGDVDPIQSNRHKRHFYKKCIRVGISKKAVVSTIDIYCFSWIFFRLIEQYLWGAPGTYGKTNRTAIRNTKISGFEKPTVFCLSSSF